MNLPLFQENINFPSLQSFLNHESLPDYISFLHVIPQGPAVLL